MSLFSIFSPVAQWILDPKVSSAVFGHIPREFEFFKKKCHEPSPVVLKRVPKWIIFTITYIPFVLKRLVKNSQVNHATPTRISADNVGDVLNVNIHLFIDKESMFLKTFSLNLCLPLMCPLTFFFHGVIC